jgi:hypothetical protein
MKTVTLGYCYPQFGDVAGQWHQSVLKLLVSANGSGYGFREVPVETGPFLSKARNLILQRSLEYGDDYVLMSDTDTVFQPEDVGLLLDADAAIAGALYYAAASDQTSWATALVEGEGGQLDPLVLPELPEPPDEDDAEAQARYVAEYTEATKVRPVTAVGCGLMLIKAEVVQVMLEQFEHPFEYVGDVGEDIIFCRRAAELGYETVVVPRARIGHLKRGVI